jgi:hypothetical protein
MKLFTYETYGKMVMAYGSNEDDYMACSVIVKESESTDRAILLVICFKKEQFDILHRPSRIKNYFKKTKN